MLEIERKWLCMHVYAGAVLEDAGIPFTCTWIQQWYLPTDDGSERRIRESEPWDGIGRYASTWTETVKTGSGLVRSEQEWELSEPTAVVLISSGDYDIPTITKWRYTFEVNGLTWEWDSFSDMGGLMVLECELPSVDTLVILPTFLEEYVIREVTGDKAFSNRELARQEKEYDNYN